MIARTAEPRTARTDWPRLSVRGILNRLIAAEALYRQHLVLRTLDDRMLRDIGVTRADIADELRRPIFW